MPAILSEVAFLVLLFPFCSATTAVDLEVSRASPVAGSEDGRELPSLLGSDDECAAGRSEEGCAVNALQRRGLKVAEAAEREASEVDETRGSCSSYGCGASYASWHKCQCNHDCESHGNCCGDYWSKCKKRQHRQHEHKGSCASFGCGGNYVSGQTCQCTHTCQKHGNCCSDYSNTCQKSGRQPGAAPAPQPPHQYSEPSPASAPPSAPSSYHLDWSAHGRGFFDGFSFLTEDMNHGAAHYLDKGEAMREGVAQAHGSHAILSAGHRDPVYKYKRYSAKIATTRSWNHFLATMRFSHVPYGCGVWPAFFTLAPGRQWPDGGEVDILEYVNDDVSKTSFHCGESCTLSQSAVNKYGGMPDRNDMNYNCKTQYPDHLGCAPNKWMRSGQGWANSPGVLALERTEEYLKVFFLPEGSIPGDLLAGDPRPDSWDHSHLISYYPFAASGCSPSVMAAQQLILSIGFCGDWASKVWGASGQCKSKVQGCRAVDPLHEYAPEQDCCTQFIYDHDGQHGTDGYLQSKAFFNISWIKVYTPGR